MMLALLPAQKNGRTSWQDLLFQAIVMVGYQCRAQKLDGMIDHVSLPVGHTFMMDDRAVQQQTLQFLQYGKFHKA